MIFALAMDNSSDVGITESKQNYFSECGRPYFFIWGGGLFGRAM